MGLLLVDPMLRNRATSNFGEMQAQILRKGLVK